MHELGMSWSEIKSTPRYELEALIQAFYAYKAYHSMDGYDDEDVSEMAKNKPKIRHQYQNYLQTQRKYNEMVGQKKKNTFRDLR